MSSNIRIQKVCQHCNKSFTAKTTVTKYCSDRCAKYAYKKKIREQKIEISNKDTQTKLSLPIEQLKENEFLTIEEVAKILRICRTTVYNLSQTGQLKFIKVLRKTIIRRSDLDAFLALNTIKSVIEPLATKIEHSDTSPVWSNSCEETELLSFPEILFLYGISDATLYSMVKRKQITKRKIMGTNYVAKSEILKVLGNPKKIRP